MGARNVRGQSARIGRGGRGWGRRGARALGLGLVALGAWVAPVAGQEEPCDERAGTLGIQGMRCEACSYRMSESGIEEARFRTEPQVLAVVRGFARGDALRAGDRIVALDGALITTAEGGRRLAGLRRGERIVLRVRRDGALRDLELTAGSTCELRRQVERGEVEVERLAIRTPRPPAAPRAPAPQASPAAPAAPAPPALPALPSVPEPPQPPDPGPSGYLGFGIRCSDCGARDGRLYFTEPPVVQGVEAGGPAARAGLRSGDVIVAVEGLELTSAPGARRFGEIEAGDTVRLRVRRAGEARDVTLVAGPPPRQPGPAPRPAPTDALRYEGRLGDTRIEVRGAPVRVTVEEADSVIVIRAGASVIRLTRGG